MSVGTVVEFSTELKRKLPAAEIQHPGTLELLFKSSPGSVSLSPMIWAASLHKADSSTVHWSWFGSHSAASTMKYSTALAPPLVVVDVVDTVAVDVVVVAKGVVVVKTVDVAVVAETSAGVVEQVIQILA